MEIQWLKQLVELLEASSLSAIELEEDGRRVRLERMGRGNGAHASLAEPASFAPSAPSAQSAPPAPESQEAEQDWSGYKEIHSPMVGTFRTLSALGKGEDIAVGAKVKKGQVICIIEAMKLMNEITADEDGEIAQALIKDAEMVEFGQVMFRYQ